MKIQVMLALMVSLLNPLIVAQAAEKKVSADDRKPAATTSPYDKTDMEKVNNGNPVRVRLLFSASPAGQVKVHLSDMNQEARVAYSVSKSKEFELNLLKDLMLKNKPFRAQLDSDGEPTIIEIVE